MKKFLYIILLIVFVSWLLPLGAYIKPSNESGYCGGQRAVCMCNASKVKTGNAKAALSLSSNSATNEHSVSGAGSAGNYYVINPDRIFVSNNDHYFIEYPQNFYALHLTRNIEHVPYV